MIFFPMFIFIFGFLFYFSLVGTTYHVWKLCFGVLFLNCAIYFAFSYLIIRTKYRELKIREKKIDKILAQAEVLYFRERNIQWKTVNYGMGIVADIKDHRCKNFSNF